MMPLLTVPVAANAQTEIQFDLPLLINESFTGDINAAIVEQGSGSEVSTKVRVQVDRLQALLENFAIQEQLDEWFQAAEETEVFLSDLRSRGLDIHFDKGLLSIHAEVPRLGVAAISLVGQRQPNPEDNYTQANFASGLSIFALNRIDHRTTASGEQGFGDTAVDVLGFTTFGGFEGWSLFYEADYLENDDKEFSRQDVTLIRDDFERGLRYSLGDSQPAVGSFQSIPDLFGVSVERNYREINPFRNISPSGRASFTLDRAAQVSFEVNGNIVDIQNLEPGSYSISDFPLTFGANNVRVYVDDGTSRQEVANFSNFVDFELLEPGLTNFGLHLGVLREDNVGRSRRYESDPSFIGFYQRGINESFTLGAQLELGENHALIDSAAVYGSRFGLFGVEVAASTREEIGTGYSALIRHEFEHLTKSNWFLTSDLQLSYASENFLTIAETQSGGENNNVNLALSLSKGSLGLSFNANIDETEDSASKSFSASVFKSFPRFSLSLDFRSFEIENDQSSTSLGLTVSVPIGSSRIRAGYDSSNDQYRLELSNPLSDKAGFAGVTRALANTSDNLSEVAVDAAYIGSRFEVQARHLTTNFSSDIATDTSTTALSAAGSIGFADGQFAYGRPFTRGFLIVDKHNNLRGKNVFVNRATGDSIITTAKNLCTTLVPIDRNYIERRLRFEVDDLPIGYDIGSGDVRIFPGNLAGYRYTLGSDASNTVLGTVTWPDKVPLSLKSGKLVPIDGGKEVTVVTNRAGRFVAEKVPPGQFKMIFTRDGVPFSLNIEIEDRDEPGLVQMGRLLLAREI